MRSPQSVSTGRLSLGGGGTFNERKNALVKPPGSAPRPSTISFAVDGVDVEVDSGAGTAGAGEPIQDRGTRLPQLVRAERLKAPLGKVRIVVVGPRMEPHQGDSVRCDDRGKHRLHLRVAVPGERGDAIA